MPEKTPRTTNRGVPEEEYVNEWINYLQQVEPPGASRRGTPAIRMYAYPSGGDEDSMIPSRWLAEHEQVFDAPGGRDGRWHNPFLIERKSVDGNPLGEYVEFFPDESLPPVQYMPYYLVGVDRFGENHLLDSFGRIANRWFEIPAHDSPNDPLRVRPEMFDEWWFSYLAWCDEFKHGDMFRSRRWVDGIVSYMYAPYGCTDGRRRSFPPPRTSVMGSLRCTG
jgi:hypothetical protein